MQIDQAFFVINDHFTLLEQFHPQQAKYFNVFIVLDMTKVHQVSLHTIVFKAAELKVTYYGLCYSRRGSVDAGLLGIMVLYGRIVTKINNIQHQVWRAGIEDEISLGCIGLCLHYDQISRPAEGNDRYCRIRRPGE